MQTLHHEIQDVVDMLVERIRKGEALVNVVDAGMMAARRFAPGTASQTKDGDIPSPFSTICTYDDDAAMMAYVNGDDINMGCRLANLAVDQIRHSDHLNGTSTPVRAEDWFNTILRRFKEFGEADPVVLVHKRGMDHGLPDLKVSPDALRFLAEQMAGLSNYLCYELSTIGKVRPGIPVPPDKAERWLQDAPDDVERTRFTKAGEIGILIAIYKELFG